MEAELLFIWLLGVAICTGIAQYKAYKNAVSRGDFVGGMIDYHCQRLLYVPDFIKNYWFWIVVSFIFVFSIDVIGFR